MFLHIGKNESIDLKDIIGIFNIESATVSETTNAFLKERQMSMALINVSNDLPGSFTVTFDGTETKVYTSGSSPVSLMKRIKNDGKQYGKQR